MRHEPPRLRSVRLRTVVSVGMAVALTVAISITYQSLASTSGHSLSKRDAVGPPAAGVHPTINGTAGQGNAVEPRWLVQLSESGEEDGTTVEAGNELRARADEGDPGRAPTPGPDDQDVPEWGQHDAPPDHPGPEWSVHGAGDGPPNPGALPGRPGPQAGDSHFESRPLSNDELFPYVKEGMNFYSPLTTWDIAGAYHLITERKKAGGSDGVDPMGHDWQRSSESAGVFIAGNIRTWKMVDLSTDHISAAEWETIQHAVSELAVGTNHPPPNKPWMAYEQVDSGLYPRGPNWAYRMVQSQGYTDAKYQKQLPTQAYYDNVYNVKQGIITVQSAFGPAEMSKVRNHGVALSEQELPLLSHWSDITWAMWRRLHSMKSSNHINGKKEMGVSVTKSRELTGWLNWIVISNIDQPTETLRIISNCLESRGWKGTTARELWPTWAHRQTFPVGHWCYYALLATPNNYGIAWLLGQHKDAKDLGIKTLKSVTIFWGDETNYVNSKAPRWPSLLWQVVDFDDGIHTCRADVTKQWISGPKPDFKPIEWPQIGLWH